MYFKPIKTKRKRREGGNLDNTFKSKDKKSTYKHNRHVSQMFRTGDTLVGQQIPHEVLLSYSDVYTPSTPQDITEKVVPWNALPQDVLKELYGNIPVIKSMVKDKVIKPSEGDLSKKELDIIEEKGFFYRSHNN